MFKMLRSLLSGLPFVTLQTGRLKMFLFEATNCRNKWNLLMELADSLISDSSKGSLFDEID